MLLILDRTCSGTISKRWGDALSKIAKKKVLPALFFGPSATGVDAALASAAEKALIKYDAELETADAAMRECNISDV